MPPQSPPTSPRVVASVVIPSFSASSILLPDSASELEYHFLLARDLGFLIDLDYTRLDNAVVEVKRMLAFKKIVEQDEHCVFELSAEC